MFDISRLFICSQHPPRAAYIRGKNKKCKIEWEIILARERFSTKRMTAWRPFSVRNFRSLIWEARTIFGSRLYNGTHHAKINFPWVACLLGAALSRMVAFAFRIAPYYYLTRSWSSHGERCLPPRRPPIAAQEYPNLCSWNTHAQSPASFAGVQN